MSYKQAITNMCKYCIYDDTPGLNLGTWRQQIKDCTSSVCPLFPYRPGASKDEQPKTKRKLSPEHLKRLSDGRRKNAKTKV